MTSQQDLFKLDDLHSQIFERRNSLSTDRLDMSFGEIMGMYERDEIVIRPAFQRLFRWTEYQKSRFLESILLGIPIPPIFVAEDADGRWELVDGLQRISSLLSFFCLLKGEENKEKNEWKFVDTELVPALEHLNIKTLPSKYHLNIKRATCRIEIIRWNSDYDMRYELFNRLNTGGTSLTDQEIRNCIYRGVDQTFNTYLEEVANKPIIEKLVQPTQKQKETMYLQELVLRFLSLYTYIDEFANGAISSHITKYMEDKVKEGFDLESSKRLIDVLQLLESLSADIFRFENKNFSTSLFDAITVGIATNFNKIADMPLPEIQALIDDLKSNHDFRALTGSSASGKTRVIRRVKLAIDHFSK